MEDQFNEFLKKLNAEESIQPPVEPSADAIGLANVLSDRMIALMHAGFKRDEAFALLALILQIQSKG